MVVLVLLLLDFAEVRQSELKVTYCILKVILLEKKLLVDRSNLLF